VQDDQLLRRYLDSRSEDAFGQLVARYLKLVYHTSLREVGNADLAEDVTQAVFLVLADKAPSLRRRPVLAGWLFQTSRLASLSALKQERRRRAATERLARETIMQPPTTPEPIRAEINEALAALPDAERDAVLMRFFEELSFQEIGHALGLSDDAAQKRVSRGVDRMRRRLAGSGAVAAAGIAALLSAEAVRAVPEVLVRAGGSLGTPATGAATGQAGSLARTVLHALRVVQWKAAAAVSLATLAVGGAAVATAIRTNSTVPRQNATAPRPEVHYHLTILDAGGLDTTAIAASVPAGTEHDAGVQVALMAGGAHAVSDSTIDIADGASVDTPLKEPAPFAADLQLAGVIQPLGDIDIRMNLRQTDPTHGGAPNVFDLGTTWTLIEGRVRELGESYGDARVQPHHYVVFILPFLAGHGTSFTFSGHSSAPVAASPSGPGGGQASNRTIKYVLTLVDAGGLDTHGLAASIPAGPNHDIQFQETLVEHKAHLICATAALVPDGVTARVNEAGSDGTSVSIAFGGTVDPSGQVESELNVTQRAGTSAIDPAILLNLGGTWTLNPGGTREMGSSSGDSMHQAHYYVAFVTATRQ
jgi:RNA polymerase sigma factor (sigma-70 family)